MVRNVKLAREMHENKEERNRGPRAWPAVQNYRGVKKRGVELDRQKGRGAAKKVFVYEARS